MMSQLERSTLPTAGHWPSSCSWWQHSGHKSLPGYKAPPDTPQLRASLPPIYSHNSPWWPPVVPRPGPGGHTTAAHPYNALLTDVWLLTDAGEYSILRLAHGEINGLNIWTSCGFTADFFVIHICIGYIQYSTMLCAVYKYFCHLSIFYAELLFRILNSNLECECQVMHGWKVHCIHETTLT